MTPGTAQTVPSAWSRAAQESTVPSRVTVSTGHGDLDRLAIELRASFQGVLDTLFDVTTLRLMSGRNVVDDAHDAA